MQKVSIGIDGMQCPMCESHIKDVIRQLYPKIKNLKVSKRKKEATFILDEDNYNENNTKQAIEKIGYYYLFSKIV